MCLIFIQFYLIILSNNLIDYLIFYLCEVSPQSTYHPFQEFDHYLGQLYPDLVDLIFVFKTEMGFHVQCNGDEIPIEETDAVLIQKWRSRVMHAGWLRSSEFPWIQKNTASHFGQMNLTTEHEHHVLVLTFINPIDGKRDLIALNFQQGSKFFGLQKKWADFTTDEKVIVSELIHRTCQLKLDDSYNKNKLLLQINKFNQIKNNSLKENNSASFFQFFKHTCQNWISDLGYSISIELTNESLHYLIQQSYDSDVLSAWILDAVELAKALQPLSDHIEIEPIHLQSVASTSVHSASSIPSQSSRVLETLIRYEEAAQRIVSSGKTPSGKLIAQFLVPAVSPPAITDFTKKHQRKIQSILEENPSKFGLIRSALKSLRDLDQHPLKHASNF